MLFVVCGLQGTGKTAVSRLISWKTGAVLLRTDVIRRELFEKPTYSEEEKNRVYEEMFARDQELMLLSCSRNPGLKQKKLG
jgi:predicted kinase